jgi:UDP-glucose 4-epimerase
MAKILVVGGAGYVGSAVTCSLQDQGHEVWVLDNLSTGHRSFVLDRTRFVESNAGDVHILEPLLAEHAFQAVFYFAAKSIVSESVKQPEAYFENNVHQTKLLLETLLKHKVQNFIFSSTCAVYGDPKGEVLTEESPQNPLNPYGESKKQVEDLLKNYADKGLRSLALRYFNASGCEPLYRVGENHQPETHLIPTILRSAMEGEVLKVFGSDYPTKDGTCVRDYIHVSDLADAHIRAMRYLQNLGGSAKADGHATEAGGFFRAFNLGSGTGYSVLEVIETASKVIGKRIAYDRLPRRPGDSPFLVARTDLVERELGFKPQYDLKAILESAYEWEKRKTVKKRAIFLDRDGTLNFDPNYLNDADKFELLPGVLKALRVFKEEGYLLYVVSNQSGVGRGMITPDQLHRIHEKLDRLVAPEGVLIHEYALCFHRPEEGCDCRKPKPNLILELASRYGIDLKNSLMIGDKISDIDCGLNAELGENVFLLCGNDSEADFKNLNGKTSLVFKDLYEFAKNRFPGYFPLA